MQRQVNIHAAKTHLSGLLAEVAAGDEIVMARSGKPRRAFSALPINQPATRTRHLARPSCVEPEL